MAGRYSHVDTTYLPAQQVVYLPFWTAPDAFFFFINPEDTFLNYFFNLFDKL